MPDITMCASETCTVRTTCRRNPASGTVPSDFRQSWFAQSPDDRCHYYWPATRLSRQEDREDLK